MAHGGRLGVRGPVPSVGINSTIIEDVDAAQNVGGILRDDKFLKYRCHCARHSAQEAPRGWIIAKSALKLVRHAVFKDLLILRRQWGQLRRSRRLGRIKRSLKTAWRTSL